MQFAASERFTSLHLNSALVLVGYYLWLLGDGSVVTCTAAGRKAALDKYCAL
jgi:hypothetical protein